MEAGKIKEKDFLESLAKSVSPAIVATDIKGKVTFFSRGAERLFGFKSEEVIGKPVKLFYMKKEAEAHNIMEILSKEGKLQGYKTKFLTKNNSYTPVLMDASLIRNEAGEVIGTIGICTSVAGEQKLEEQVKTQEKFLAFILKNSAEAIIGLDMEDRIMVWNKGAEMIFGYTEEEVKGKQYYFLLPEDIRKKGEVEFLNKTLWSKGYIQNYETERICKDGKRITISLTRSLIKDEEGNPIGNSTIIKDITYQKQLEKQMVFTEKMATIGKLAFSLAHEIGTPINILSGRAEYIKKLVKGDEEICRNLDLIIAQAERITKIVSNLLNAGRDTAPEITKVSLKNTINTVLDLLKTKLDRMGIKARGNFKVKNIFIEADANMMQQVFINLLVNSIDAFKGELKRKEKIIKINTQVKQIDGNNYAIIEVIDNGCGIPEENIGKIFEPFFTTKSREEGTGLGLSIVAKIIQDHKGSIEVKSEYGKGTNFIIKLPINSYKEK